jgi:hypothetical protein
LLIDDSVVFTAGQSHRARRVFREKLRFRRRLRQFAFEDARGKAALAGASYNLREYRDHTDPPRSPRPIFQYRLQHPLDQLRGFAIPCWYFYGG